MTQTKHTPEPWIIDHGRWIYGPEGNTVAQVAEKPTYEEAEANARLIAAAPDLLEALQATLNYAEYYAPTATGPIAECFKKDHAALSKAKGA